MTWSANPAPPDRKYGPSWTEGDPGPPPAVHRTGWTARLEKVAPLTGAGNLTVAVNPHGAVRDARFSGGGTITAGLLLRNFRAADFSTAGVLVADIIETRSCTADFTGDGELASVLRDGLSAIVIGTYPAGLSGDGALVCVVTGGQELGDGLSAIVQPATPLSGEGTLTATVTAPATTAFTYTLPIQLAATTATGNLTGTGALSAMVARASVLPLQLTFILK